MSRFSENLERLEKVTIIRAGDKNPAKLLGEVISSIDTDYFVFLNTFDELNSKELLNEAVSILDSDKNLFGVYGDTVFGNRYIPSPMFNRKLFVNNFIINTPIILRNKIGNYTFDNNIQCMTNYIFMLSFDNLYHLPSPIFKYTDNNFIDHQELEYVKSKTQHNANSGNQK